MSAGRKTVGIGALVVAALIAAPHLDRETHRLEVVRTERTGGDDGKYLVFGKTPEGKIRVLENTDSVIEFKWNSSDLYTEIEAGKTYDFGTYGFRIPFFSQYENILSVKPVNPITGQ